MGITLRQACRTAAGLSLALMLLGCAATTPGRVSTEVAPSADFTARHTFAWQDSQASLDSRTPEQDVEALKQTIRSAVVQQLEQKGFRETADSTPDFLVSFHLVVTVTTAPQLCMRRNAIFRWPPLSAGRPDVEVCEGESQLSSRPV